MPSRILTPSPPPYHHRTNHLVAPLTVAGISLSFLVFFAFLYRKLTRSRTAPAPNSTPERERENIFAGDSPEKYLRRFRFSQLKKATSFFSESNRLGQGGFGSVYRADFVKTGESFAVKVMDAIGSIQGEREFRNELAFADAVSNGGGCRHLVSVIGYATSERCSERKVLVYELMCNGSLQEKLLDSKSLELCVWEKRMKIIVDIAKALRFLHFNCGNTPIVHGDVKPSNVLLDDKFNAKLGDFGLAKVLDEVEELKEGEIRVLVEGDGGGGGGGESNNFNDRKNKKNSCNDEVESIVEEEAEAVAVSGSPSDGLERASSMAESWGDKMSVESVKKKGWGSGRDYWWWKQGGDDSSSGRVKDYVMEWIGSEINKEIPKTSSINGKNLGDDVVNGNGNVNGAKIEKKKKKKRLDWWWGSLDEEEKLRKKGRKPREWWKEEFCEELNKKNNKLKTKSKSKCISKTSIAVEGPELWWQRDEDFVGPERKKRRKSRGKMSFGSIDWWLDGLSGELRSGGIGRRNSQDWGAGCGGGGGGEVPKSGGISSTPSMRGTVCYIAPEYGGGGQLSEKCDVYSFGVLVLVVISGRRPLQVLASPMSEFERANLVSWARQLAYSGKLLDLVDTSIQLLDKEQVMVCITIALLCLQRSPSKRPNMKEIVEMLTGVADPPHLPFEFSPSPPSGFPFKSRKKGR
ncbi:receptor-like serine/threonine-protein kinase At2g45590 [Silene latifolia]|uniref:receptor-like serine/threonine-protein kinase At2g45590 n=1 Tax=Silene latifolia TaxID=37657 RepID=UPI003D77BE65